MKKIFLFTLIATTSIFTSCDILKDAADIDFSTTITQDLNVYIDGPEDPLNTTIDLSLDNEDTNAYLDKIKNVKIKKLTYTIVDFTGDPEGEITGVLKAGDVTLQTITSLPVKQSADAGTVFEITDTELLHNAAVSLLTNKAITLQINGSADCSSSMTFKVHFSLDLDVTANPLD